MEDMNGRRVAYLKGAKIYRGDQLVLQEVDFSIAEGEFVFWWVGWDLVRAV